MSKARWDTVHEACMAARGISEGECTFTQDCEVGTIQRLTEWLVIALEDCDNCHHGDECKAWAKEHRSIERPYKEVDWESSPCRQLQAEAKAWLNDSR